MDFIGRSANRTHSRANDQYRKSAAIHRVRAEPLGAWERAAVRSTNLGDVCLISFRDDRKNKTNDAKHNEWDESEVVGSPLPNCDAL